MKRIFQSGGVVSYTPFIPNSGTTSTTSSSGSTEKQDKITGTLQKEIVDVLKENDVKATFFITGHYLNSAEDIVKRMIEEGHIVGNHTVNHKSMPDLTDEEKTRLTAEMAGVLDFAKKLDELESILKAL